MVTDATGDTHVTRREGTHPVSDHHLDLTIVENTPDPPTSDAVLHELQRLRQEHQTMQEMWNGAMAQVEVIQDMWDASMRRLELLIGDRPAVPPQLAARLHLRPVVSE